jgi:hypothetical protein
MAPVLLLLLPGLSGLGGCATVGAELRPGQRATAEGFVASLHDTGDGRYQAVVRHPSGGFRSPGPVVARPEGEAFQPVTSTVGRTEVRGSGLDVEWALDKGDGVTLELRLGGEPGSSAGLELRAVPQGG